MAQDIATSRSTLPFIWVNGKLSEGALHLSALDRGFTLADGLFETMRAEHGIIFRLDRHLDRLTAGARVLSLPLPSNLLETIHEAMRTVRAAGFSEVSIRLTISRGVGAPGLAPPAETIPTVVLTVHHLPEFPSVMYHAGISARIVAGRRNEKSLASGIKSLAYTESVIALTEARRVGTDDAILLDTEGHISESSASNLFLVIQNTLVTPPKSCGVLPGITREAVLELAPTLHIPSKERPIPEHELFTATEAFLTSSLRRIVPLVRVNDRPIGSGDVGPITRQIMASYTTLVHRECTC